MGVHLLHNNEANGLIDKETQAASRHLPHEVVTIRSGGGPSAHRKIEDQRNTGKSCARLRWPLNLDKEVLKSGNRWSSEVRLPLGIIEPLRTLDAGKDKVIIRIAYVESEIRHSANHLKPSRTRCLRRPCTMLELRIGGLPMKRNDKVR